MTIAEPLIESTEDKSGRNIRKFNGVAFREADSDDGHMSAENLGTLLRQVSKTSLDEIDNLVRELQTLRRKLQTDGDRIQREIAEHGALSQQVMQLTKIISDSVKKLPGAQSISR
jgi:DNA anti-recombination protein RmuC